MESAEILAAEIDEPVLVEESVTPTEATVALPDGSLETTLSTGPVRVIADGMWEPIDLTLTNAEDGRVEPIRAATPIVFGDPATPNGLVSLTDPDTGTVFDVRMPGADTSRRTLDGSIVRFLDVLPGIDLELEALTTGFAKRFVVRERPTGQLVLQLHVSTVGAELSRREDGGLRVGPADAPIFASDGALMWGAEWSDQADIPTRVHEVDTKLIERGTGGWILQLRPDMEFLRDESVQLPIVVDPATSVQQQTGDTFVQSNISSSSQWSSGDLRLGTYNGGSTKARTLVKFNGVMNLRDVSGMDEPDEVIWAELDMLNYHSWSCSARETRVLRNTTNFGSSTVWSSRPSVTSSGESRKSFAYGYGSSCNDRWATWDVTKIVKAWADSAPVRGITLMASNESDNHGWKKFRSSESGYGGPELRINWTRRPELRGRRVVGHADPRDSSRLLTDASNDAGVFTRDATPQLQAIYYDRWDNGYLDYEVHTRGGPKQWSRTGPEGQPESVYPANAASWRGTNVTKSLANGRYRMRVRARDVHGARTNWSSWAYFTVDRTGPSAVTLSSTTHPSSSTWYDRKNFTLTWNHATTSGVGRHGYLIAVNANPSMNPNFSNSGFTSGTSYSIPASGQPRGTTWVHVRPVDLLGNLGPVARYKVNFGSLDPRLSPLVEDPRDGATGPLTNASTGGKYTRYRRPYLWGVYGNSHLTGKLEYKLQTRGGTTLWTVRSPSSSNVADGTTRNVRVPSDKALADGHYRFQVRAITNSGIASPWTGFQQFTVDQTAPSAVALSSTTHPDDTLWYDRRDLRVDWTHANDSGVGRWGYLVIIDDKPGTNPTLATGGLTTDNHVELPAASQSTGVTFVHVRPIDLLGNLGTTSHFKANLGSFDPSLVALGDEEYATWSGGVNAPFGNFVDEANDITVPSVGPELAMERTYNSRSQMVGPLGWGWTSTYASKLQELENGAVAVLRPDGDVTTFTSDGTGGFTTEVGERAVLASEGTGHVLTEPDGTTYHYRDDGQPGRIVEEGDVLSLQYDADDRLRQVLDESSGRSLWFSWTGGHITEVATDPVAAHGGQLRWRYHYDGDQLRHVCGPTDTSTAGRCVSYDYYDNKVATVTQPNGDVTLRVVYATDGRVRWREDGLGNRTTFTHSSPGTVEIELPNGGTRTVTYDEQYRTLTETSPEGRTTSYEYDAEGNRSAVTDGEGTRQETTYDELGNVTSTRCVACGTAGADVTTYDEFDSRSRVLVSRDGRSSSDTDDRYATTNTYDPDGRLLTSTSPPVAGHPGGIVATTNTYTSGSEPAVGGGTTPAGLLRTTTDANGHVTSYEYESDGDLARESRPGGLVVEYGYDELGRRIWQKEITAVYPGGLVTTTTYDEIGNEREVIEPEVLNRVTGDRHKRATAHTYDDNGNVLSTTVRDQYDASSTRTTTYTYDVMDRQIQIVDAESGVTSRGYDELGNVAWVTDAEGRTLRTDYDLDGLATSLALLTEGADPADPAAPIEQVLSRVTYDNAGRSATTTDANGNVTETIHDGLDRVIETRARGWEWPDDSTGTVVLSSTTYDGAGNAVRVEEGQDQGGLPLRVVANVYDGLGRLSSSTLDPGGLDRVTTNTYDGNGNVTMTRVEQDGRREETRTEYGPLDLPEVVTVENGATDLVTRSSYDEHGRPILVTSPLGSSLGDVDASTGTSYDEAGQPWRRVEPQRPVSPDGTSELDTRPEVLTGYDAFGNVSHTQTADGEITTTAYDRLDRRTRIEHPTYTQPGGATLAPVEVFTYDAVGNLTSRTTRRGATWEYRYDRRNRAVSELAPPASDGASRGETITEYDAAGNVTATVDPLGARTETTYDVLGNPDTSTVVVRTAVGEDRHVTDLVHDTLGRHVSSVDPLGGVTRVVVDAGGDVVERIDAAGEVWRVERDGAGRVVREVDPAGPIREHVFDLAGRQVEDRTVHRTSGAALSVSQRSYDAAGNVVEEVSAEGRATRFDRAGDGTLLTVEQPTGDGTVLRTAYRHDATGRLSGVVDGNGNLTTYAYNPWGLQETLVEPSTDAHPDAADRTWTTVYDAGGLPIESRQPGGVVVTRTFDALGRETQVSGSGGGTQAATETTTWDIGGRRATVSHPDGDIQLDWDDRGLLAGVTGPAGASSFDYDQLGRQVARTDATGSWAATWTARSELETVVDPLMGDTVTWGWDAAGRPQDTTFGDGSAQAISWDDAGRRASDVWRDSAGGEVLAHRYSYDADGQLTSRTVSQQGVVDEVHGYGYDAAGRLRSWTSSSGTVDYDWDGAGNRVRAGGETFTYDARNRLTSGPEGTYVSTPRGDQASVTGPGGTSSWEFDALGRAVTQTTPAGTVTTTFDGFDRVAVRDGAAFAYAGVELDPVSDGVAVYGRTPQGTLNSTVDAGVARRVGLDQHGDVVGLFDLAGGVVGASRVYDPFGSVAASSGSFGSVAVGFQGDWTDAVSGEVWQGARWYQPATGRFTSRDTVRGELMTPVTLNRYLYAQADPLRFFDPDGRYSFDGGYTTFKATYANYERATRNYTTASRKAKVKYRARQQMRRRFATVLKHESPPPPSTRSRSSRASGARPASRPVSAVTAVATAAFTRGAAGRSVAVRSAWAGRAAHRPDNYPVLSSSGTTMAVTHARWNPAQHQRVPAAGRATVVHHRAAQMFAPSARGRLGGTDAALAGFDSYAPQASVAMSRLANVTGRGRAWSGVPTRVPRHELSPARSPGSTPRTSPVAKPRGDNAPTVVFSRSRAPGIARTFDDAVAEGAPTRLTRVNAAARDANRRAALRGKAPAPPGQSLDEYPFACSLQGGCGATVRSVPRSEQSYQGGVLSRFFQDYGVEAGDNFDVMIGP